MTDAKRQLPKTPLRVVMCGPLPPAIGGMASVIGCLSQSELAQRTELVLFDTGKKTLEGRSLLEGIRARLVLMREWRTLLRHHRADIAHIHTCSGLTFFLDGLLASLARNQGCRVVLHVHGGLFDQFLDNLHPLLRALARYIARQASLLIVLSEDWRQRLAPRLPGSKISVLTNGVAEPECAVTRGVHEYPTFVFLGLLSTLKGIPVLLDALARARVRWRVQLAGNEGEPGFADRLQAEISRLGFGDRMKLLGPVVGPAKDQLLAQADAFVLPSLAEGLPMSLLEAMASRLPVVVTAVGAMPEVIDDGIDGLLVPPNDAAALASAMDWLAQSPEQRVAMGRAGYAKYRARYSVDAMVQALLDIYASEFGLSTAVRR
ncbi:glycosyltransferase family 4 protein [Rhodoferax sp. 4810]|nr:glycosyltransferase family 4 protein [Rhodoferax jenense]